MQNRKDAHVELALSQRVDKNISDFDNVIIEHHSIPNTKVDDVDLSTTFANISFETPFFINAMTGGSTKTKLINERLAEVAKRANIAIASGSLSSALKDETYIPTFSVLRDVNSEGIIFANVGAEYTYSKAQQAVNILNANALQIHVNVIQEIVMPEGDRDFTMWQNNIKAAVENLTVPVIVKEVGFGMSSQSIKQLIELGVKTIDISGYGGTNFAKIENARRTDFDMSYLQHMGISTVQSLLNAKPYLNEVEIIASGGIRNPLDVIKCLVLGAQAVGISGLILESVEKDGVEQTVKLVNAWKYQLKLIMSALGVNNIKQLQNVEYKIK